MLPVETLPNAPITEAIIDFKFTLPAEVGLEQLAEFHAAIRERFPKKKPQIKIVQQLTFTLGKETKSVVAEKRVDGYRFVSEDEKTIIQVRKDRFSFHRLRPYSEWKTFSEEAKELWKCFCGFGKPINVQRLALRYLNRIEIPFPIRDFRDYCLLIPEVPPEVPQDWSGFFLKFSHFNANTNARGNVILTMENVAENALRLPLIFDIDTFYNFSPMLQPTCDTLWERLENLRNLKNGIFFSCLTESAIKLFK